MYWEVFLDNCRMSYYWCCGGAPSSTVFSSSAELNCVCLYYTVSNVQKGCVEKYDARANYETKKRENFSTDGKAKIVRSLKWASPNWCHYKIPPFFKISVPFRQDSNRSVGSNTNILYICMLVWNFFSSVWNVTLHPISVLYVIFNSMKTILNQLKSN